MRSVQTKWETVDKLWLMKLWVLTSPPIFASCRYCPPYSASSRFRDLSLASKTTVRVKRLSAKSVSVILLPAESLGREQNQANRIGRKPLFIMYSSIEVRDREKSLPKPNMGTGSLGRNRTFADYFIPCEKCQS